MAADESAVRQEPDPLDIIETRVKHGYPICGLRARSKAFLVDALLMVLFGMLLGALFGSQLTELGGWGRFVGLAIALAYFGILNSSLGKGQSIGKMIMRIRVVGQNGKPIPLRLSLLRALLLYGPYFLLNAPYFPSGSSSMLAPVMTNSGLGMAFNYVGGAILFAVLSGITYFYVFNRRSGQSLHDFACRTYVVRSSTDGPVVVGSMELIHYVAFCVFSLLLVLLGTLMPLAVMGQETANLIFLQNQIREVEDVLSVSGFDGPVYRGDNEAINYLGVNVYWNGIPPSAAEAAERVARIVLDKYPQVQSKNEIWVRVIYGYDIGIANSYKDYRLQVVSNGQRKP